MSVRRQTANRLTLFRTCGTCGKQIVTTADTPWVRQVERDGERVRAIHYVADFAYERPTAPDKYGTVFWLPVVEDVKSRATKTAQYEMKKKLLRERFNLTITEV